MDDLIGRLVAIAGVDRAAAEKAVGIVQQLSPEDGRPARALVPLVPGADSRLRRPRTGRSHAVSGETVSFARETAQEAAVGESVDALPGPGRLV